MSNLLWNQHPQSLKTPIFHIQIYSWIVFPLPLIPLLFLVLLITTTFPYCSYFPDAISKDNKCYAAFTVPMAPTLPKTFPDTHTVAFHRKGRIGMTVINLCGTQYVSAPPGRLLWDSSGFSETHQVFWQSPAPSRRIYLLMLDYKTILLLID